MQVRCPVVIGRAAELDRLNTLTAAVARGAGAAVFLGGEAGIGKTRLVRETVRRAPVPAIVGRAVPAAGPVPLRPLVEATAAAVRRFGLPDGAALGPYAAALGALVPEWSAGPGSGATGPVLAEGLLRLLRAMAPTGYVLVLEDLHWADPETLAVLEYLADHAVEAGMVLIGTLRATAGSPPWALADALARRGSGEMMLLDPLDAADVHAMIQACGLEADIAVAAASDGIPLLVEELLGDRGGDGVPRSLAESVRRRMAALNPAHREALAAAAPLRGDREGMERDIGARAA